MQDEIINISKKLGVPTSKLYELLYFLRQNNGVENNDLINYLGVSKNVLNQIKEELGDLLEPTSTQTKLSKKGEGGVDSLNSGSKNEDLFEFVLGILKFRPSADRDLDQFLATADTVLKRASLLNSLKDLNGKRILFLGDDDFTSLAVAKLSSAKVTVLDIDSRILENIKKISQENNLDIEIIKGDLKDELPEKLNNSFDVIFSDPPYTPDGFKLFVSRGIQALDPENLAARLYLCFGTSDRSKERALPIFETIIDSGLFIRSVFDGFNRYIGAESIGSSSNLIICDVTPKTKPLVKGKFSGNIYTNN